MKYDRPVWKIMHECADAMPETLRYEDVRDWFLANYPEVNDATVRAHLIGLSDGGRAKHVQFAPRSPVFRRLARGEYQPIPKAERGENPDTARHSANRFKTVGAGAQQPAEGASGKACEPVGDAENVPSSAQASAKLRSEREPYVFDVILLGSLGDRTNVPAPAKQVFREVEFQQSRADAELAGGKWFVLSAEHGLVAPNEWITPDFRTLADMEPGHREIWAAWVVARLISLVGPLEGLSVRVDAPAAFVGPLFSDLQAAGALVSSGNLQPPIFRRDSATHNRGALA